MMCNPYRDEQQEPEPTEEEKRQAKALKKARLKYGKERRKAPKWMRAKRHA